MTTALKILLHLAALTVAARGLGRIPSLVLRAGLRVGRDVALELREGGRGADRHLVGSRPGRDHRAVPGARCGSAGRRTSACVASGRPVSLMTAPASLAIPVVSQPNPPVSFTTPAVCLAPPSV